MEKMSLNEDYSDKLQFAHRITQRQLLTKIHSQIEDFAKKNGCITAKNSKDCPELLLMLDLLIHKSQIVGTICSHLILQLVKDKYVLGTYIVTSAIAFSALKRPMRNYVKLVISILEMEDNSNSTLSTLTRIYSNCQNESIEALLCEIQEYLFSKCSSGDERSFDEVIVFMKPFLEYVMSKGKHSHHTIRMLLTTATLILQDKDLPNIAHEIFYVIVELLTSQENLQSDVTAYVQMVIEVVLWYLDHIEVVFKSTLNCQLAVALITSVWNKMSTFTFDNLSQAFCLLKELLKRTSDYEDHKNLDRNVIFVCGMMLMKADTFLLVHVLEILLLILPKHLMLQSSESYVLSSVLVLPMLQILSETNNDFREAEIVQSLAENIFTNLQKFLKHLPIVGNTPPSVPSNATFGYHSEIVNMANSSMSIMNLLLRDEESCTSWLKDLMSNFVYDMNVTLILSSLLLRWYPRKDLFRLALHRLVDLCKHDSVLVLQFIPMLVYFLNDSEYKSVKIDILYTIPKLACGKMVISSILKLVMYVSTNDVLLPTSIRMMTSLWQDQVRVFPYLYQLLNKKLQLVDSSRQQQLWLDWMLAKASAILNICEKKAFQYGKEMIVMLSAMIEALLQHQQAALQVEGMTKVTSCLAIIIESIKAICLVKVIDIQSIWKAIVLKVQPKKKHPIVLRSLCSLCDVIPQVCSETRQAFFDEVLQYLWYLVKNEDVVVSSHAFRSLSCFPASMMRVKFLPGAVSQSVCQKLQDQKSRDSAADEPYEPMNDVCPGYGFMELLHELHSKTLPGFQRLVTRVLQNEIDSLPRDIGRRSFMKPAQSIISKIPQILMTQYEVSTRPGVLPGIAAGLLACYEQISVSAERQTRKQIFSNMEKHKHMMNSFLHDYVIHTNDWLHAMYAPKLWFSFMVKVYDAFIEGRIAELEMKNEKGLVTDEEIHQDELDTAKYWARDQITNLLKTASRGSPKVQGNSVFGLVGLANAVFLYENENIKIEESHQYISMRSWLLKVSDTVMVVFNGNFRPKSKPFQWCQQVSSDKSSASSTVSRCSAALVLSELVRPLLSLDTTRIVDFVVSLKQKCSAENKTGNSSAIQFYVGLGYGLLLSRLSQTRFGEIISSKEFDLGSCLRLFDKIVFNENVEEKEGAIIGFGLVLSTALLHSTEYTEFAVDRVDKLRDHFRENRDGEIDSAYCFLLACLSTSLYSIEKMNMATLREICELVKGLTVESPKMSDYYVSLGMLNSTMMRTKITEVTKRIEKDLDIWRNSLSQNDLPSLVKHGIVKGVFFTFGIADVVFDVEKQLDETIQLKKIIKYILHMLEKSNDNLVSLTSARLLGHLHLSVTMTTTSLGNLPSSYSYIGQSSMLSTVFDFLSSTPSITPRDKIYEQRLKTCLDSMIQINCKKLPPVDWTLVLSPLLRFCTDISTKLSCFKFAEKYASSDSNVSLWLASWLQTASFCNMHEEIQLFFYRNVARILPCLSNTKQELFLDDLSYLSLKTSTEKQQMMSCILSAWLSVAEMEVPIQSTIGYIIEGLKKLHTLNEDTLKALQAITDVFATLVYKLFPEKWRIVLPQLKLPTDIETLIYNQMLGVVELIERDDILRVATFCRNSTKKAGSLEITSLLRTLTSKQSNDIMRGTLGQLKNKLATLLLENKLSKEEEVLYYMAVFLTSNSKISWLVCPVESLQNYNLWKINSTILQSSILYFNKT